MFEKRYIKDNEDIINKRDYYNEDINKREARRVRRGIADV